MRPSLTATRGWGESLFDDEILGMYQFEMSRKLDQDKKAFFHGKYSYPYLNEEQIKAVFDGRLYGALTQHFTRE